MIWLLIQLVAKVTELLITEVFIRGRKLNISTVFIMQSCFKVPKDIRLNSTQYFIMKIPIKRELQQITINHSSDIDFMKIYNTGNKELLLIKDFISVKKSNSEIVDELKRIAEEEQKANWKKMLYEIYKNSNDCIKFKTIRVFGSDTKNGIISLKSVICEQEQLVKKWRI